MKKLLLMMVFTMFLSGESSLQAHYNFKNYQTTMREIPVKGVSNGSKGDLVMRSIPFQYVRVFICDKNISVIFLEPMVNVLLVIKNTDTGQIVYSEDYYSPDNISIELDAEEGNFQISIVNDNLGLQGDFTL